eukprot:Tamp_24597.p1 GENE.Tamp_24597~~Tamp_24597.p1  ORF type:complete len:268 (+),score=42.78 Tamp_24597:111-914(+)
MTLQGVKSSWFWEQAALQGLASAQLALGEAYRDGSHGVEEDLFMARCFLQLAAQQGCPEASFALAEVLLSDPELFMSRDAARDRVPGPSVRVSGVTLKDGMPDTWCCGQYVESALIVNRRAVYRKVGDGRFALWYDSIGMWRLGDISDVGSTVGRASVESDAMTPFGTHLTPWTVFVWSGREVGGEWVQQLEVKAEAIEEDEGLTGVGGAAWEPVQASADDVYKEAIAWLQAAGRKCYEPALRRMKRMGLSTLEYRPRPAYRPPPML